MKFFFACLLFFVQAAYGQKLKKSDRVILNNLLTHVNFLSSDKLEGRRTGTRGEILAYTYLADQFKLIGLQPKGDSGTFLQHFTINEGRQVNDKSHLIINGNDLKLYNDFFPFCFSGNKSIEATPVIVLQEIGQPWFWDLRPAYDSASNNPHFDIYSAIINNTEDVITKGASGLFV